MREINKEKLIFINQDAILTDVPFKTKEISYYQDAWNRFKKNKITVIAAIIISILLVFVIIGPHMKVYNLKNKSSDGILMKFLPPKIPLLENLGIFDGMRTISSPKGFLLRMYNSEFGEGIIKSGLPQKYIDNPTDPEFANTSNFTVKVDYYRYTNYINSIEKEDGTRVTVIFSETQFQEAMKANYIIEVVSVVNQTGGNTYVTRVDYFRFLLNQTPEDTYFWFGTDDVGRDCFTLLWDGSRISIIMALVVTIINAVIGLTIGAIAGYYGGTFDLLFTRLVEIFQGIPLIAILTILIARFGSTLWIIAIAFLLFGWTADYGTGRFQFYRFKGREYVLAARTLGASDKRIMFKHILPNGLGMIISGLVLAIPSFILSEASWSFLGIFDYGDSLSVGMLLKKGQDFMVTHPHILLFPAIYILIMMLSFNMFGNGLRDALNPQLRGVE